MTEVSRVWLEAGSHWFDSRTFLLARTVSWSRLANVVDSPRAGLVGSATYRRIQRLFSWAGLEVKGPSAETFFRHLEVGQPQTLKRRKRVNGELMYLVGLRLEKDYLIVATDLRPQQGLATYGLRWGIETLFGCLKSRGFNLEQTHVTQSDKLSRLLILLAIAVLWAFSAGLWLHQNAQDGVGAAIQEARARSYLWT